MIALMQASQVWMLSNICPPRPAVGRTWHRVRPAVKRYPFMAMSFGLREIEALPFPGQAAKTSCDSPGLQRGVFLLHLHLADCVYIAAMLATPELIREAGQLPQLARLLPRWRAVPLYRNSLAPEAKHPVGTDAFASFRRLPLLAKQQM